MFGEIIYVVVIVRFATKWKLSLRYIGTHGIIVSVGALAYQLQLLEYMQGVHPVFSCFYVEEIFERHPKMKIEVVLVTIKQDMTFDCLLVQMLEFSEQVMCNRAIKYVKVLWTNQMESEAT